LILNGEYYPLIKAFGGQALNISTNTDTHINPFDSSLQYAKNDKEAIKEKSEFILAFIESIVNGLSGEQKTLTGLPAATAQTNYDFTLSTAITVAERVRGFDLASSTPMECMLFISDLKKSLSTLDDRGSIR